MSTMVSIIAFLELGVLILKYDRILWRGILFLLKATIPKDIFVPPMSIP